MTENEEDAGTLAYLEDTASQAGLKTTLIDIEEIGLRDDGHFVDLDDRAIELAFKLYPWEWMFHDAFGAKLCESADALDRAAMESDPVQQGHPALLWEMFPNHPNLLPAYFEDDPNAAKLGTSFVRKPLYSREGANIALVSAGTTLVEQEGPYGAEGFIRQALAPLPSFSDQYAGARKLAGRSHAMRPVDPRGREPDHRQHVTVLAACDFVARHAGRRGEDGSARRGNRLQRMGPASMPAPDRRRDIRTIKSAPLRIGLEGIGDADHGFGRAQRQHAVGLQHPRKPIEDVRLAFWSK